MKRKSDPRHEKRVEIMKSLFGNSFLPNNQAADRVTSEIALKREEIDNLIKKNAPAWPIDQISPIDLAILRLAVWELIYKEKKEPYKVIIDEAVEIAKEYGNESSPAFINGVLGSIVEKNQLLVKSKDK